jgi:AcrR family transcriptional regulator
MSTGMGRLGRDALVREALAALAANPTASMGEVATHLGVGRTTLYRHFGDREAMIAEVARLGARLLTDAVRSARPEVGSGLDAVERVCTQLFTVPDALTLLFADNPIITDDTFAEVERERRAAAADDGGGDAAVGQPREAEGEGDAIEAVIARGQADGSITSEVPVDWAAMYVFLTVGSGHLHSVSAGVADREARARALALTIRAVRRTLAAD